jgi:hypothetical protein
MVRHVVAALVLGIGVAAPATAGAQTEKSAAAAASSRPVPTAPAIHHVPVVVAREDADLDIGAAIDRPDLIAGAALVYRHGDHVETVPFERSASAAWPYVAVIPAEHVKRPQLAYAIEIQRTDGTKQDVFASADAMQPIEVVGDPVDAREESLLARLDARRFVVEASGEYVYFGTTTAQVCPGACAPAAGAQPLVSRSIADQYWRTEASFTYRLLRTVSEFGIRGGVYRGTSVVPDETDASKYSVGLNYGAPWVRIRAEDWLHFEGEFLTSVTEVGFSVGGGAAVLLGDPYASHLTLGFEAIDVFGVRGYSRFDAVVNRRLRVSPTVEVTTMPHAADAGVRLLMDLTLSLDHGFTVTARGGYQARNFDSGGPAAGASVGYAF